MDLQPWETLGDERLTKFKVFDVRLVRRRSPRTGGDLGFFLIDTLDWVNVVAVTRSDELILVRQFRHGSSAMSLEIPGGVVEPDEDLRVAAARELREETGFEAEQLTHIGSVNPNSALFTNRCSTYLATGCVEVGALQQDAGEDIEVVAVPLPAVDAMVRRGEIDHSLVLAGLYFYRLHLDNDTPP